MLCFWPYHIPLIKGSINPYRQPRQLRFPRSVAGRTYANTVDKDKVDAKLYRLSTAEVEV